MRTVQEPPRSVAPKNFPRASTWPCTRCPPSRVTGVTERSRFTGMPGPKLPSVDRSKVSRDTSAANELLFTSSAVRQTPLTAIESPSWMSSVTTRALSPRCLMLLTRPSSSMIPVNIVEFQIVDSHCELSAQKLRHQNNEQDKKPQNCRPEREHQHPDRFQLE